MSTLSPLPISCRVATDADWPAIWPIFREVVRAGDTYSYSPTISEDGARALWMPDAALRRETFVATIDDVIVGTAYLRPNSPGLGDHVANAGFMVSAASSARGVGRAMGMHVLDVAKARGFLAMQFNYVVASNTRAVALWKSLGFNVIGTSPRAFRHATLGLTDVLIMHRAL